jgi:hypothetical protein
MKMRVNFPITWRRMFLHKMNGHIILFIRMAYKKKLYCYVFYLLELFKEQKSMLHYILNIKYNVTIKSEKVVFI